ncbi:hypothetical protein CQ018_08020 [Arthrobacter sp. MYb227]|uniref:HNH endonuclease signature motif containing protein n=1 Tax=Arthrobacter sp. MYb227 TaxID=1848601 RepID=UPI000CFD14E2|nr:HNH endonuclease signature motif containing protein [Arthrobacter sp. MYb227]PQZ93603.1 hypothetical protein CQ018_08020 [Arthrobacter sp. MYb227]
MSSTPMLPTEAMTVLTSLVNRFSDAPEGPAATPDPRGDALRLLALLIPTLRMALEHAAANFGSSPVRSAVFLRLTESLYRQAGYGQLLAVSRSVDAQVHQITEEPLAALNQILEDSDAAATHTLPADVPTPAGRKPLFREDCDFLEDQLNLTHFQAQHRVESAENLLPHTGFNGQPIPPKFPHLGKVLSDGAADPKSLASLAKKFEGLGPAAGSGMERELADAVRTRNSKGTEQLLKDQAKRLNEHTVAEREEFEDYFIGIDFLGHTPKGYEYKIITTAEGHELLSSAADILNSPRSKAGTKPSTDTPASTQATPPATTPELPAEPAETSGSDHAADSPSIPAPKGPPLPEWAAAKGTALEDRPVGGIADPLVPCVPNLYDQLDPNTELRPGESIESALTRQRARRLHQLVLDALRMITTPDGIPPSREGKHGAVGNDEEMPLPPNVMLNVTMSYETFIGQLEKAGVSDHGADISPANCRRLACIAGIIPIVLNGEDVPLALGRTRRYFNRAQRRAIAVRDKGCINPGCTVKIGRCEAHHIDLWILGGRTDVDRGCLLCPMCHAAYHAGKFKIKVMGGIPHVIQPRSRDPLQLPRRNWIFHPTASAAAA